MSEEQATEAKPEREWPYTLKLKRPVQFGKDTVVESLTFQRGKMRDVKDLRPDRMPTIGELLMVASRMCGRPVAMLELLSDDDGPEVLQIAGYFFGKCL